MSDEHMQIMLATIANRVQTLRDRIAAVALTGPRGQVAAEKVIMPGLQVIDNIVNGIEKELRS